MTEEIRSLHVKHGDAGTSACCRPKTDETTDYFPSKKGATDIHIELQCGVCILGKAGAQIENIFIEQKGSREGCRRHRGHWRTWEFAVTFLMEVGQSLTG